MRLAYLVFWCSTYLLSPCLYGSDISHMVLYPLCKLPDGPLYYDVWLLYVQEATKSAIMLWQEGTQVLTRLTSARFNPKKVRCSPNGGIISFLDDGILWLRRISRRYTRSLETAFPIGTIIDYDWYDINHIIVCARKGPDSSIYCINLDGTVCGELSFTDTRISSVSCSSTSLLCIAHERDTPAGNRLIQINIDSSDHPITLHAMRSIWSSDESLLFCKHITSTTAYAVTVASNVSLQDAKNELLLCGSLYHIAYAHEVPVVYCIGKIPLKSAIDFDNQGNIVQRYPESVLAVMPTVSPDKTTLAVPLVAQSCTSNTGALVSRLMLFDCIHNTSRVCTQQEGLAFLSPQWTSEGFFCGGAVAQQEQLLDEPKKSSHVCIMYYDEDVHKLVLPHVPYGNRSV